jgi:hypothetical protein
MCLQENKPTENYVNQKVCTKQNYYKNMFTKKKPKKKNLM